MAKHFLRLKEYSQSELAHLLTLSAQLKDHYRQGNTDFCLKGKTVAMMFEKPSSRTRISFQVAISQLGASSIYMRQDDVGALGKREPVKDLARVMNGYVDAIVARVFDHNALVELAQYAKIPVINALSDVAHPCQAMADVLTIQEHLGKLDGLKVTYIGDGNNVAASLAVACIRFNMTFAIASPKGYELPDDLKAWIKDQGQAHRVQYTCDPIEAVKDADVVYTDTWVSMGQEAEKEKRVKDFNGYQINAQLMSRAKKTAKIMHCLPAYRGLEITDEAMESPQSIIFDQAENRLHFQRGLLKYLLT